MCVDIPYLVTYNPKRIFSMDPITTILIALFVILAFAEFFLPGGISISIGLAALVMALLRYLGIVENLVTTFSLLPVIAMVFVAFSFKFLTKYFSGDSVQAFVADAVDINDDVVDVLSDISEEDRAGRVRFQGASWQAISRDGSIQKGERAKVVSRDGLVLIVEPLNECEKL